ncbi:MAG: NAD(P)H-dependent oxidoreductase [Bacteroidia bacterium]|nr:NAD(P)H-dependent oxidoreductase [Bacteroidia bacterium]
MSGIIIQGSSRSMGNTFKVIQELNKGLNYSHLDLLKYDIGYYDYAHSNDDDFIDVMRTIVDEHSTLVIATPVYWYTMSGLIKVFMDRITECLNTDKDLGRRLRGMRMAVLACGSDNIKHSWYFEPFRLSADYLGMHYIGDVHTWIEYESILPEVMHRIEDFRTLIMEGKH